jgi:hypothetical protein
MLKNIKGLSGLRHKDSRAIYRLWRQRIVKHDESNGDSKFIAKIELGGKSANYWKTNR